MTMNNIFLSAIQRIHIILICLILIFILLRFFLNLFLDSYFDLVKVQQYFIGWHDHTLTGPARSPFNFALNPPANQIEWGNRSFLLKSVGTFEGNLGSNLAISD